MDLVGKKVRDAYTVDAIVWWLFFLFIRFARFNLHSALM